jgi:hypothetical protein
MSKKKKNNPYSVGGWGAPDYEYVEVAIRDAAHDFIHGLGVDPTPDAIDQLAGPFAECLRIMCERGYDPEGTTWASKGWKGLVHDILNKSGRLRYNSWRHNRFDADSAIDMINFAGFYWRLKNKGSKWGDLGEPG